MAREQIKCMINGGMFIGPHGYDHYWMDKLSAEKVKRENDQSLGCMDGIIDSDQIVMNYPYGAYDNTVIEYLQGIGCKLGLTTEVRVADLVRMTDYCCQG